MASDRVVIVKRSLAAFARRDMEALLADTDPQIQVRAAIVGGLEGTVYRGHAGLRQFVADIDETWSEFRVEAEEFLDLRDRVLVLSRTIARGMGSGLGVETASGLLFDLRDGRIHRMQSFVSREAALAAAGLAER